VVRALAEILTAPDLVALADIEAAAETLRGVAVRTPLLPVDVLTEIAGVRVYGKAEMPREGSFNLRGAYHYLSRLDEAQRARGIVAPSSGNHAQAVALAARLFDVPATVVMPTTVTAAKRAWAERLMVTL
jgi:threonine dehydratase